MIPEAPPKMPTVGFPESGFKSWHFFHEPSQSGGVKALVRIRPNFRGLLIASFRRFDRCYASSVSGHRIAFTKPPNTQSPFAQVRRYPYWRSVTSTSCGRITPGPRYYELIRRSRRLFFLRPKPHSEAFAGCYQPLLPPGPSRRYSANLSSDDWSLATAVSRNARTCFFFCVIGLPQLESGSASRFNPRTRLFAGYFFEAADISLCSGLRDCLSPRSFLPLHRYRRAAETFTSGQNALRYLRTHRIC
jgi:hypothetical protein